MAALRALKVSIAIGVVLLVLACSSPIRVMDDIDRVDDSDRADYETAAAPHDARSPRVALTPPVDD
jgi:hypothetical protein